MSQLWLNRISRNLEIREQVNSFSKFFINFPTFFKIAFPWHMSHDDFVNLLSLFVFNLRKIFKGQAFVWTPIFLYKSSPRLESFFRNNMLFVNTGLVGFSFLGQYPFFLNFFHMRYEASFTDISIVNYTALGICLGEQNLKELEYFLFAYSQQCTSMPRHNFCFFMYLGFLNLLRKSCFFQTL